MLTGQYRLCEALEEVFNELFYDGKITNGTGTLLAKRGRAQKALQWIQQTDNVCDHIPHVALNVLDGVQIKSEAGNSFNLRNVLVTIKAVERMLDADLWKQSEMKIIQPLPGSELGLSKSFAPSEALRNIGSHDRQYAG